MCGSVTAEYLGTGNDRDDLYFKRLYVRENISCLCKTEPLFFSVEYYLRICFIVGSGVGTGPWSISLNNTQSVSNAERNLMYFGVNRKLLLKVTCLKKGNNGFLCLGCNPFC